jgi:hypothetical protein
MAVFAGLAGCQAKGDLSASPTDAASPAVDATAPSADASAYKAADGAGSKGSADEGRPVVIPPDAGFELSLDASAAVAIDAGTDSVPVPTCSPTSSLLHPRPAEALLIQDRSTAMAGPLDSGTTKWAASGSAIVTAATSGTAAWGMMLFPKPSANGECCQMPTNDLSPEAEIAPSTASAGSMSNLLAQTLATGIGRPIASALVQGANYLLGRATSTAKYLVLIAAGEPTCASDALCSGASTGDYARTKDAVTRSASLLGIPVAVVAVGLVGTNNALQPGQAQQLFSDLAKAGGMPNTAPGQPSYYAVESAGGLTTALNVIAGQMRSCSFGLATRLDGSASGEVTMSEVRIAQDPTHQDGWDLGDDRASVVLYGKACAAVRAAAEPVSIQFVASCPSPNPVI